MSLRIRPSVPGDGPAIVAVVREAGLDPITQPQALHWKYWRPRADWPGPRSLVMTKDERIVAHIGIVPGAMAWGTQRASVIHVIDWAASAEAALAGSTLMKHVCGLADVLIAAGGSADTLRLLPILGFRHCGAAKRYVRTLRPWHYLTSRVRWNWKTLPKFARGALASLGAPAIERGTWSSSRLTAEQIPTIAPVLPRPSGDGAVLERSPALLSYLLGCPIATMALYSVAQAGRIRGYFLLAVVPGQARIVDCWMDSPQPDAWHALVQCALDEARKLPGVAELVTTECDSVLSRCLEASGFPSRSEIAIHLRARKGLDAPTSYPRVQMLDSDDAYHYTGHTQFWG